jgi:uncharacterized protein (DUF1800 family)
MHAAAIAAHRFGYSETSLRPLQSDPRGWVLAQWREPAPLDARGLLGSAEAGPLTRRVLRNALTNQAANGLLGPAAAASAAGRGQAAGMVPGMDVAAMAAPDGMALPARRAAAAARQAGAASAPPAGMAELDPDRQALRRANTEALQRRWQHAVNTPTPVVERWTMFWCNHFCVAATKGTMLGMVGPHELEAIRPNATGRFRDLLKAATLHPSMLLYLDNAQSIGPDSRAGRRRERGLNENLARELLELHTVGVNGGYTQADVTELARLLTGWTVAREGVRTEFIAAWHQPGPKQVLGRRYEEGPEAVDALFDDLSRRPATARFVATKLVRHFVADQPPPALVDAVAARFLATDGQLGEVAQALFGHDLAWRPDTPPRFKRPEELVLSAHRVLKLPVAQPQRLYLTLVEMGQAVGRAPSPQGWPDRDEDWLAPDALWKRVQWAAAMAAQHGALADARQLAQLAFGPDLGAETLGQIERADSGQQALALLLSSPEFQRR